MHWAHFHVINLKLCHSVKWDNLNNTGICSVVFVLY